MIFIWFIATVAWAFACWHEPTEGYELLLFVISACMFIGSAFARTKD